LYRAQQTNVNISNYHVIRAKGLRRLWNSKKYKQNIKTIYKIIILYIYGKIRRPFPLWVLIMDFCSLLSVRSILLEGHMHLLDVLRYLKRKQVASTKYHIRKGGADTKWSIVCLTIGSFLFRLCLLSNSYKNFRYTKTYRHRIGSFRYVVSIHLYFLLEVNSIRMQKLFEEKRSKRSLILL